MNQKRKDHPSLLELCDAIKDIKSSDNDKQVYISKMVKDTSLVKNTLFSKSELKDTENGFEKHYSQKFEPSSSHFYSWDFPKEFIESDEDINKRLIDKMLEPKISFRVSQFQNSKNDSIFAPPAKKKPEHLYRQSKLEILFKQRNTKKIVRRSKSLNEQIVDQNDYFPKYLPITADALLKTRLIISPTSTLNDSNKKTNNILEDPKTLKMGRKKVLSPIKPKFTASLPNHKTKQKLNNSESVRHKYINNSFNINKSKINVWEIFEGFLNQTQPMTPSCTPNFFTMQKN